MRVVKEDEDDQIAFGDFVKMTTKIARSKLRCDLNCKMWL